MSDPDSTSGDCRPSDEPSEGDLRREEFASLIRLHNDALIRFVATRLKSGRADAQDIVQEAIVKLLGLADTKVINYQRAYLYKICANLANTRLRERASFQRRLPNLLIAENLQREEKTLEESWIARQERERLEQAVEQLPPNCRLAFKLVAIEGEGYKEAAEQLGTSAAVVRKWIQRSYEYLARTLDYHGTRVSGEGEPE